MELLIGSGFNRTKRIGREGCAEWNHLITLDLNPHTQPDVIANLENLPLPFQDNVFDEIHAYHVLEHVGQQGDWRFFLKQFEDFWRILKPYGFFMGIVPSAKSIWAWGDPGHSRLFPLTYLSFLSRKTYQMNKELKTMMSDYRYWYEADFELLNAYEDDEEARFVLRALK